MKEAIYFSHDSNARNDEKLLIIRANFDYEGYGWYFAILELLRESSDYSLSKNVAMLKICLNINKEYFKDCFEMFFTVGLFKNCENDDRFFSESFMGRMSQIDEKRRLRAEAGRLGGQMKSSNAKAKVKQTYSKGVASKVKESKVKESKIGISDKSDLHSKFVKSYFDFYEKRNGVQPNLLAKDYAALKKIKEYFIKISDSEAEALINFEAVLSSWGSLDKFYQQNILPSQIHSNLATIINILQNGKSKSGKFKESELKELFGETNDNTGV